MLVVYTPEAQAHLIELYRYVSISATEAAAERLANALVDLCDSLAEMPNRGAPRGDIRKGMRILPYRRKAVIAYAIEANQVSIMGVFYGGRDIETLLAED